MSNIADKLPQDNEVHGTWISRNQGDDKGDVHVYVSKYGAVIGQNFKYRDKIDFSDMALSLGKGKATFQYADEVGNAVVVDLPAPVVSAAILKFLGDLQATAQEYK